MRNLELIWYDMLRYDITSELEVDDVRKNITSQNLKTVPRYVKFILLYQQNSEKVSLQKYLQSHKPNKNVSIHMNIVYLQKTQKDLKTFT